MWIREMNIGDYEKVLAFWKETSGLGVNDADEKGNLERFLKRNQGLSFLCEEEGLVIGTVLCGHDGRRGYIYHLAVAEKHRCRGIGRHMADKSLALLKKRE